MLSFFFSPTDYRVPSGNDLTEHYNKIKLIETVDVERRKKTKFYKKFLSKQRRKERNRLHMYSRQFIIDKNVNFDVPELVTRAISRNWMPYSKMLFELETKNDMNRKIQTEKEYFKDSLRLLKNDLFDTKSRLARLESMMDHK